jgi:glutathione S-transferase
MSLADLHLAPMMSYFVRVPEGNAMLANFPALSAWWGWISAQDSLRMTDPLKNF